MQETLPPLLGTEEGSLAGFRVNWRAAVNLSPLNGATILAYAGARLTAEVDATRWRRESERGSLLILYPRTVLLQA